MAQNDEFQQEDLDDEKTIEYIKNYMPQELKGKFSDDELHYILDLIDEYYIENEVYEEEPDEEGYINIDLDKVVDYVVSEANADHIGEYDPEEILLIVQAELEYGESLYN